MRLTIRKLFPALVLQFLFFCHRSEMGVEFLSPANKAVIRGAVPIKMAVNGMTVKPAGVLEPKTGHFHVLIDKPPMAEGQVIPADGNKTIIHYGQGQTEAELALAPGRYRLTLQFADGNHVAYGPQMASSVEITVE